LLSYIFNLIKLLMRDKVEHLFRKIKCDDDNVNEN